MDYVYKQNAKKIGEAIKNSKLSPMEIALRLGVTHQSVYKWVATGQISRTNLAALGKVVKTNFDDIRHTITERQIKGLKHKSLHLEIEKLNVRQAKEVSKFIKSLK